MGEKQKEGENKPRQFKVEIREGMAFADTTSALTTVSGSIYHAISELSPTLDDQQKSIAEKYQLDDNTKYLKQIAESMDDVAKLAKKQRDDAIEDAKRQKRWSYVSTAIAVVAIIVTIIVALLHL